MSVCPSAIWTSFESLSDFDVVFHRTSNINSRRVDPIPVLGIAFICVRIAILRDDLGQYLNRYSKTFSKAHETKNARPNRRKSGKGEKSGHCGLSDANGRNKHCLKTCRRDAWLTSKFETPALFAL